mmetsp:Transcript_35054/g.53772  ORF Transcript_35054/g.53772 Transcript_35054/m.53772 type:complete len:344 (+) Transcript_35054:208-1239(+)
MFPFFSFQLPAAKETKPESSVRHLQDDQDIEKQQTHATTPDKDTALDSFDNQHLQQKQIQTLDQDEKSELDDRNGNKTTLKKDAAGVKSEEDSADDTQQQEDIFSSAASEDTMWHPDFHMPIQDWTRRRWIESLFKCMISASILTIRLVLDPEPRVYVIHSVIIFIDMFIIHFFTHSVWLSVSGELTTILFMLAFHFSKETVFELLETTCIAMLASFHLIVESSKLKERRDVLEHGVENLRNKSLAMLERSQRNGIAISNNDMEELIHDEEELDCCSEYDTLAVFHDKRDVLRFAVHRKRVMGCGRRFFEHFLDGSAGVMYTSFFGLILEEIIKYASGEDGMK